MKTDRFPISSVCGSAVAVLGAVVMLGWHMRWPAVIQIRPDFMVMQYNTALGFLLCGAGSIFLHIDERKSRIFGIMAALLGVVTLVEYILAIDLGVNRLFMEPYVNSGISLPGRMAPNTALSFVLTGAALSIHCKRCDTDMIKGISGAVVLALGFVALSGYFTGMKTLYTWKSFTGMAIHTAVGFMILGIGIITFAWNRSRYKEAETPRWSPVLIGIGIFAVVLLLWQALKTAEQTHFGNRVKMAADAAKNKIQEQILAQIHALIRMANRWEARSDFSELEWRLDASRYVEHYPFYQAIEWADPSFHVRLVEPFAGNENVLGMNLALGENRRVALDKAVSDRVVAITHQIDLAQGGKGFLVFTPVFHGDALTGVLVGIFRIEQLLRHVLNKGAVEGFSFAIHEGKNVIWQNEKNTETEQFHETTVEFYGITWRIRAWLNPEKLKEGRSLLPETVLILGSLAACLVALAVYFGQVGRRQAREVESAKRNLEKYVDEIKWANEEIQKLAMAVEQSPGSILMTDIRGRIEYVNPSFTQTTGYSPEEAIGKTPRILKSGKHAPAFYEAMWSTILAGKTWAGEFCNRKKDGRLYWELQAISPIKNPDGDIIRFVSIKIDDTERKRAEEKVRVKANQQAALANLGLFALENDNLENLMKKTVDVVTKTLAVEFAEILELSQDGTRFLLRAGVGWKEGLVGNAVVGAHLDSHAGYTLISGNPVIMQDLKSETRFSGPPLLHIHGVVSGINIIIKGRGKPFGVFGAHTAKHREFTDDDIYFLQIAGNILASAMEYQQTLNILWENQENLIRAQKLAHLGNWMWNISSNELRWSDEVYRIFGVNPWKFGATYESFLEFIHPDDREFVKKSVDRALREKKPYNMDHRIIRPDGSVRTVNEQAEVVLDAEGNSARMVGTVQDITERKAAENAFHESEARLNSILDNMTAVVYIKDMEGRYVFVNRQFEKLFKLAENQLLGKDDYYLLPAKVADKLRANDRATLEAGSPKEWEEEIHQEDGAHTYISVKFPLRDIKGDPYALCGISMDITVRKQAEKELTESREQLRDLNAHIQSIREEERTRIAREIHDEMGQALTALKIDLAWLNSRIPSDLSLKEKMQSMSAIIDDGVRTVQRIASELRPQMLDVLGLPDAIKWQARSFQNRTGILCSVEVDPDHIQLDADRSITVFRIFQEILTNVARHAEAEAVVVRLMVSAGHLVFEVEDDGKGIKKSQILSPASLGFIGIRERLIPWKGEFNIQGSPGKGTTISVLIPL